MARAYPFKSSTFNPFGGVLYVPSDPSMLVPAGFDRRFSREENYTYADAANYYKDLLAEYNAGNLNVYYTTWFFTVGSATYYEALESEFKLPTTAVPTKLLGDWEINFDDHRFIRQDENSNVLKYYYDEELLFSFTWHDIYGINTIPWYYPDLDDSNIYFYGIRTGFPISPEHYVLTAPSDATPTGAPCLAYITRPREMTKEKLELFYNMESYDPVSEKDPFDDGGTSEPGGGGGNFSEDSDIIDDDPMPFKGAVGTGFATLFTPSTSQLRDLSRLFWNADIFAFLQNMVENINSMFTSLGVVPFDVPAGNTVSVTWLGIDTAISLTLAQKQYIEFNMGSINLANDARIFTSNSALDYSPFSKLGIYLPFIGFRDLDIDECRNSVMGLKYKIDILSGTCVAIISLNGNNIYQFSGNCLSQIPITNENMASLISNVTNVAIAGANAYNAASATQAGLDELGSKATDSDVAKAHLNITHGESKLASSSANAVLSGKPTFEKTGSVSASAALMSIRQPYLFLTTPRQSLPANYNRYKGYPCNMTSKLGDLRGYTVVEDIRLNGLVATSPEVSEIYELLKGGVII